MQTDQRHYQLLRRILVLTLGSFGFLVAMAGAALASLPMAMGPQALLLPVFLFFGGLLLLKSVR